MTKDGISSRHVVTADMLHKLPEPVQRYMVYTGVVGKPWINTVLVKYAGKFRPGPDKPWMPITAKQFYITNRQASSGRPPLRWPDCR